MKNPPTTSARPRLSVAMIVRDEEDVLAQAIESVRPIADEVVVLDTGSVDQTPALAEKLGAVVREAAWADDFSDVRNRCLQATNGEWVLWLDAGERLAVESAVQLREFIDQFADPQKVYSLAIETPPPDRSGSSEQMQQIRLMPRGAGLQFRGRVRETLRPAIEVAALGIDVAPGRILRHPRLHDPVRMARKANRDLSLAALEAAPSGHWPLRLLLAVGEAHNTLGNVEKAREEFRSAIRTAEHGSAEMLEAYYGLLTTFDGDAQLHPVQLSTCLEALEVFPLDAQLLMAMGNYMLSRQRPDLAVRSFDAAVRFGKVRRGVWHLVEWRELAAVCLALALQVQGRDEDARQTLEQAVQSSPESMRVHQHLINLYVKHGQTDKALALAERAPLSPDRRGPFCEAVLGACKAVQHDWRSALGHLQSAYLLGCRGPFCLRWIAVTLLSNGQVDAARPVLEEWQQVEPQSAELQAYLAGLDELEAMGSDPIATGQVRQSLHGRHLRLDAGTGADLGTRVGAPAGTSINRQSAEQ